MRARSSRRMAPRMTLSGTSPCSVQLMACRTAKLMGYLLRAMVEEAA
jgi:hypothetical protein